jgi:hypothetical protein
MLIDIHLTRCTYQDSQRTVAHLNKVRMNIGSALLYLSFHAFLSNMLCSLVNYLSISIGNIHS